MKKVLSIIWARPQFIKHAPVDKIIKKYAQNITIHTWQHFDTNMSDIFFEQLGIDKPEYNLNIHGGNHGAMTWEMMIAIEAIVLSEKPDYILVYGDTNSTLAWSLVASKLYIPVIHVEAGLRSGDKKMPEEINRIMTDHVSTYLFSPTDAALENLKNEGITQWVVKIQDPMYLTVQFFREKSESLNILRQWWLRDKEYYFCTFHRPSNTDKLSSLQQIVDLLNNLNKKVIFPIHPRTKQKVKDFWLEFSKNIIIIDPVWYIETLYYIQNADAVITDSGGLQKEAYILWKNIFTLRDTTEWWETIMSWRNILLLNHDGKLLPDAQNLIENYRHGEYIDFYGQWKDLESLFANVLLKWNV